MNDRQLQAISQRLTLSADFVARPWHQSEVAFLRDQREFFREARTDIAALLDEVKRLRAAIDAAIATACYHCCGEWEPERRADGWYHAADACDASAIREAVYQARVKQDSSDG